MSPEISVVIPVYNNQNSLNELSGRLLVTLGRYERYEIIFINDGSADDSGRILRDLAQRDGRIKVIDLSRNFGQHPAICAGFEHAKGDVIVLMDADLQDRPEDIPELVDRLKCENTDVTYTIKVAAGGRSPRRLTSTLYHYIFSRIVKMDVPMNIGTFRVFNRKFLDALLQFKEANVLYGSLMFYMGYKSSFMELPYVERQYGRSSYTFSKRLKLAANSLISYTDIPHRLLVYIGSLLLVGSVLYSLAILGQYFLFGSSLPGGSTLILLVLFLMLGSLMMFLGIIGSYIFRVYQEVLKRPRYLVQEKINLL